MELASVLLLLVGGALFIGGMMFERYMRKPPVEFVMPTQKKKRLRYNPANMLDPVVDAELLSPVTPKEQRIAQKRHGKPREE